MDKVRGMRSSEIFSILIVLMTMFASGAIADQPRLVRNMNFVRDFHPGADPVPYERALHFIARSSREDKHRLKAMKFMRELLGSQRYRQLHSWLWLRLADFHAGSGKEALLLRALQRSRSGREKAAVFSALAEYYGDLNQTGVRKLYLQRLTELMEQGVAFPDAADAFRDLGMIQLRELDAFSALRLFLRALEFHAKPEVAGDACLGAAVALGMMNKPYLQKTFLKRALDHAQKWKIKALKIRALSRYSQILMESGEYAEALRIANLSVREERTYGKYVSERDSLFRKGLVLERMGHVSAMVRAMEASVKVALKKRDYDGFLPVITYLADIRIARGEFSKARQLLFQMDDIFAPNHPLYFLYHYLEGRLGQEEKDFARAEAGYSRAVRALRRNLPSFTFNYRSFWKKWLNSLYSRMIRFRLDRFSENGDAEALESAIRLHEEKNELLARCIVFRGSRELSFQREEKRLQNQFNHYLESGSFQLDEAHRRRRLEHLRRQFREIQDLRYEAPRVSSESMSTGLDPQSLRRGLEPQQLIVKYMVLEKKIAVITLGRNCFRFRYLGAPRARITGHISRLVEPLNDFARGQVDYLRVHFDLSLARKLYQYLLEPLEEDLTDVRELIVIPEKELFHLPFDALVTGYPGAAVSSNALFSEYSSAEFLIQRYQVSLAFSMAHVYRRFHRPLPPALELVAFSGPVVPALQDRNLSGHSMWMRYLAPLPSTLTEVKRIARQFPPGKALLFAGEGFTTTNFRRHAPRARIVHLATHYITNLESPWLSGLLFSPDPAEPGSIRLLRANDAQHIPIPAELLVLSACESFDQRILGIQGMTGITAAFSENGVRSALVSMWPVDEFSSQVLPLFYRHYLGLRRASLGLRRAKLEFMQSEALLDNGERVAFAHPFFWSNFQLLRFRR